MDSKLKLFLDKIKLDEKYLNEFQNGKILKIICSKDKLNWNFIIEVSNLLSIELLTFLDENIGKGFPNLKTVTYTLKVINQEKMKVKEYFPYVISSIGFSNAMLSLFSKDSIKYTTNGIVIGVYNKAEENIINNNLEKINHKFSQIGFDINLKTELSEDNHIIKEKNDDIKFDVDMSKIIKPRKIEEKKKSLNPIASTKKIEGSNAILGVEVNGEITDVTLLNGEMDNVIVEGYVFGKELFESPKTSFKIITLKFSDNNDSILVKIFFRNEEDFKRVDSEIKENKWYRICGNVKYDNYASDFVLNANSIVEITSKIVEITDDYPLKRVELHTHTLMSQMDGVVSVEDLIKTAKKWGHRGIAVTDHDGVQSFPNAFNLVRGMNKDLKEGEEPFKMIYGAELVMIDDNIDIVINPTDENLKETTFVVFDLETTGFNAGGSDSIIEIGAVKIKDGVIIDTFDELIDPGKKLTQTIIDVTHITDEMLKGKPNEEETVIKFKEWFKDLPLVAHNAKFDTSFMKMAYKKYNLGELNNTILDTLELSRALDQGEARHSLSAITKRYNVVFDEDAHHRANYDAEGTALVLAKMIKKLIDRNMTKISDLNKLVPKDEIHKYGRAHDINILTLNQNGLKNLFRLVSLANTTYLYKTPRILRSVIEENREGLLIGSGCYRGEVFTQASVKSDEELTNILNFYDYIEVQPIDEYCHLVPAVFATEAELIQNVKKIVRVSEAAGKMVVATGDVHHLSKEDKIYREIILNQKIPGRGRHPLSRYENKPTQHFRTTDEMMENFSFLGEEKAKEIVITNTNKILDKVEVFDVIVQTGGVPFSPRVKSDDGKSYLDCPRVVTDLVYDKAKEWYGDPLPHNIESRLGTELYGDIVLTSIKYYLKEEKLTEEEFDKKAYEKLHNVILKGSDDVKDLVRKYLKDTIEEKLTEDELEKRLKKSLGGVIGAGFDPIYLIAQRLVKKSNNDGYLVGSRGSVGSSFVATMMGITEVNPLPSHYRCEKCKTSIFEENGEPLGKTYLSGFDLPNKACPNCGNDMFKDGQDIPFATFLGFNADKVPDIDLNFSEKNQAAIHEYTKVLFGVDNVYRAGTIGTVAEKTAYGFVRGYFEDRGVEKRGVEIERLLKGCTGVKRTTGQHPGGIVVIPDYMDVFDFTPFQFPAEDPSNAWRTTHFDYHKIEEDVLKLDILGHTDPTQLRMLKDMTGTDVTKVPLDDKETMGIFLSPEPLGVTVDQIMCNTGTLGVPEFGTKFTIQMVEDTKPTSFAELIKISGLSHGTDVWLGNAQELIKQNVVPFSEVIGCRDDIMVYLMYNGLKPITAFKIMEFVRKGRASKPKDKDQWAEYEKILKDAGIADWYIDSCHKIKYMFPKAHAAAYVTSAFRIAWYKVHMPVYYYVSWLTCKANDVELVTMIKGYDAIKERIIEINNKGRREITKKEFDIEESLHICLEASARGIKFLNIDLYESEATDFVVKSENEIIPPFNAIEGLGDVVAKNIVEERKKKKFLSIEDLQIRAKISESLIDVMRNMHILDGMDESNQLSLF